MKNEPKTKGASTLSDAETENNVAEKFELKPAELAKKEKELIKALEELCSREESIVNKEKYLLNTEKQVKQKETELTKREAEFAKDREKLEKELEKEKESLRVREKSIQEDKIKREQGYTDERKKLDDEIFNKRKELTEELNQRHSKEMQEMSERVNAEEKKRLSQIEKEVGEKIKEAENKEADINEKAEEQKQEFSRLKNIEIELERQKMDLGFQEALVKQEKQAIEEEVKRRTSETENSFEADKSRLEKENIKLRDDLRATKELWDNYEDLRQILGDEPEKIAHNITIYKDRINSLEKELQERPSKEIYHRVEALEKEKDNLNQACSRLSDENLALKAERILPSESKEFEIAQLKDEKLSLENRNKLLAAEVDLLGTEINQLKDKIDAMRLKHERTQDRDARIKDIEIPYFPDPKKRAADNITEIDWLNGIMNKCSDYGLKFPKRILYAYHTALKTAEWSPLTVLAGVSGTGKSELPKLYAHFGGMNFLNVSVQPNWDSQESMLGFFNSIDNRFDTQPVLRLLAQTQRENNENYPGLHDVMTLILLDEMNLAYIELYFAEFLSKLESRRGKPGIKPEFVEVKLGSGLESYKLYLDRNVLWTGTMNQDETTKSLSDKVLDRGIIISFPRPTVLERRNELKPLGKPPFEEAPLLPRSVWKDWRTMETSSVFTAEDIAPYKSFVEEMNESLSKVSRALGHRVWQSVEYYMANYPGVNEKTKLEDQPTFRKLMRTAFEDQLVQKIMPKLRGIETRGDASSECLDKIRDQLVRESYNIVNDFDMACKFDGQFNWNSAKYLEEEEGGDDIKPDGEAAENKG